MKCRQIHESDGQRTLAVILELGDEIAASLKEVARDRQINAAQLSAIGALSDAVVAYFDWQTKEYEEIPVNEQVEVAALLGDIALDQKGEPTLHMHVVLGKRDGSAIAGHLAKGDVRPTLEVVITESPGHLRRKHDPQSGLALIE
jgi:predicted DNA-binding protein with PD1-like motif